MPIYHCQTSQHNKFWKYEIQGKKVVFTWGRIGGSSDTTTKAFSSESALQVFVHQKIREKEGKDYKLVNENIHTAEAKTAQSLGIENKIQRILWVNQRGSKLTQLNSYDPTQYVYVEILNSWSKQVTRLLLNKATTWQLSDGISESDRTIFFDTKTALYQSQFADTIRTMLKGIAVQVAETLKTVKFAAAGARNLFDDDAKPATTAQEEVDVSNLEISGCAHQVVSKFAALGSRSLDL